LSNNVRAAVGQSFTDADGDGVISPVHAILAINLRAGKAHGAVPENDAAAGGSFSGVVSGGEAESRADLANLIALLAADTGIQQQRLRRY
jgi:hypothetical protein